MAETNFFDQFDPAAVDEPAGAVTEADKAKAAEANFFDQFQSDEPLDVAPEDDPTLKEEGPGIFSQIGGALEVATAMATGIIAEPMAGLRGLGAAAGTALAPDFPGKVSGAERGAEEIAVTREAMTYQPGGETGKEMMGDVASFLAPVGEVLGSVESALGEGTMAITGNPELATAAHTLPTALMEVLGLGLLRKPSQAARNAARAQSRMRINPDMSPEAKARAMIEPEMRSYQQITEDLRTGDIKKVVREVRPDEEIIAAAEALGVELNPSHYSTSEAFMRVEQAVKSQPGLGTRLAAREADAIKALGEKADELIGEVGGDLNKALLETRVRNSVDSIIDELSNAAEQTYKRVNDRIPPATKVRARASDAYINQRLADLGGDVSLLSAAERKLHRLINGKRAPTYAALDEVRRQVGQGFKRLGVFKDDLSGNLNQVYEVLIIDQQGIATALGAGVDFVAGRKLVSTRKQLESKAMQMFGRDMNKSILPKLTQSATALTKGDVLQFKNLMEALPSDMRTPAAATLLNDLFTQGARTGGSLGQGFAKAYANLNRNAGAKTELFKYLPKEAQRRFDAIGKVSEGIFRAKALENTSRTANAILQALSDGSMVGRIANKATESLIGIGRWVPGLRTIALGGRVLKDTGRELFNKAKAADNLMSSTVFSKAINKAMEGKVQQAEMMLKRSKAWQAWRNTLGEGTKAQLVAQGPIAWLTQSAAQEQGTMIPPQATPEELGIAPPTPPGTMPPNPALQPPVPAGVQ